MALFEEGWSDSSTLGRHLVALSQNLLFLWIGSNGETSREQISIYTRVMCSSRCTSRDEDVFSSIWDFRAAIKYPEMRHQRWICYGDYYEDEQVPIILTHTSRKLDTRVVLVCED